MHDMESHRRGFFFTKAVAKQCKGNNLYFTKFKTKKYSIVADILVISELRVTSAYHGIILPPKCHQRKATKKRCHRLSFDCWCKCGKLKCTSALLTHEAFHEAFHTVYLQLQDIVR